MKKVVYLVVAIMLLVSCKDNPQVQEIEDFETGYSCEHLSDTVDTVDTVVTLFHLEPYFIEGFVSEAEGLFIIVYTDAITEYGGYLEIECSKDLFFEVIHHYYNDSSYTWVDNYKIKEVITPVEGEYNFRYYLIKQSCILE